MSIIQNPINSLEIINMCMGFVDSNIVVENVCAKLPMDELVRVCGGRGVGKSYFLKMLAGLQAPISGKYLINKKYVNKMSFEEFLPYRLNIGYAFEYGGLISNLSLYQNLMLPLEYHSVLSEKDMHERVMWYMSEFNLVKEKDNRPAFVSGSMKKEVCVLRAFILEPEVLILDNPTVGLNKGNIQKLKEIILNKKKSGSLKHAYIVSDNEEFLSELVTYDFKLDWTLEQDAA